MFMFITQIQLKKQFLLLLLWFILIFFCFLEKQEYIIFNNYKDKK